LPTAGGVTLVTNHRAVAEVMWCSRGHGHLFQLHRHHQRHGLTDAGSLGNGTASRARWPGSRRGGAKRWAVPERWSSARLWLRSSCVLRRRKPSTAATTSPLAAARVWRHRRGTPRALRHDGWCCIAESFFASPRLDLSRFWGQPSAATAITPKRDASL